MLTRLSMLWRNNECELVDALENEASESVDVGVFNWMCYEFVVLTSRVADRSF